MRKGKAWMVGALTALTTAAQAAITDDATPGLGTAIIKWLLNLM